MYMYIIMYNIYLRISIPCAVRWGREKVTEGQKVSVVFVVEYPYLIPGYAFLEP